MLAHPFQFQSLALGRGDARRLWCIFELAAFLKSHEDAKIVFKPTALGPATLLCSLTIGGQLVGDLIWPYASGLPTLVMRFLASALVAILLTWPVWVPWTPQILATDASNTTLQCL